MTNEADTPPRSSRILYPELPTPLTPRDLTRLFKPGYDERRWASTVARALAQQVGLLVQLKIFQAIGRFLPVADIPTAAIDYVTSQLGTQPADPFVYPERTLYRHQGAVLLHLGVTAWGPAARALVETSMAKVAKARTDPTELINTAIDELARHRFELPALIALRRLAGTAHHAVNARQWDEVSAHLSESKGSALEALLIVVPDAKESPFAQICAAPGRASHENLKVLIERYRWLLMLPDPTIPLQSIPDAKVLQWANEARRLKAPELRRYVTPRRHALLLAVIRHSRGQMLDDLTQMFLRLARRIEWKSEEHLIDWYAGRHSQTDSLITALRDSLRVAGSDEEPPKTMAHLDAVWEAHGGREALEIACAEHLRHERQNWRPFARQAFVSLRATLMRLIDTLPLKSTPASYNLLDLATLVALDSPPFSDYLETKTPPKALPRE